MRRRMPGLVLGLVLAALVLQACGHDEEEQEPTVAQALAGLDEISTDVLHEVAKPDTIEEAGEGRDTPCGGPFGTEWSSITVTYDASAVAADRRTALDRARAVVEAQGLEADPIRTSLAGGREFAFSGEGFRATVAVVKGRVAVSGVTECLGNPER